MTVKTTADKAKPILSVRDLTKHYPLKSGVVRHTVGYVKAVDGVSFNLYPGETLGVVGESGCGKSTLGRLLENLEPPTSGTITFEGRDVTNLTGSAMRKLRRDIQIVFQDPYTSLDPRMTVGDIVGEAFRIHPDAVPRRKRTERVKELLDLVGLNPEHINRYPHEFSGGQRQRIGIARGIALNPKVLVCDEAGVSAGCFGAGSGRQPATEIAAGTGDGVHLHRPRPVGGAPHLRSCGRHVPREDHGDW